MAVRPRIPYTAPIIDSKTGVITPIWAGFFTALIAQMPPPEVVPWSTTGNTTVFSAEQFNGNVGGSITTVSGNAQPNITSVGVLTGLTVLAPIVGNIAGSAYTAGSATTARTVTLAAQPAITSVGTLISLSITGGLSVGTISPIYSYQTPTTGFNIVVGNNISTLILEPAGTLATGAIVMPSSPVDGQQLSISSTQTITSLTVSANAGQFIKNAPTSLVISTTASQGYQFKFKISNSTWYRLQ